MGSHRVGHDYQEDNGQHTLRKEVATINNKNIPVCVLICSAVSDSL